MSYLLNRKPKQPNFIWPAIGILAAIAVPVAIVWIAVELKSPAHLARQFDANVARDPTAPVAEVLKAEFPDDYQTLKFEVVHAVRSGATQQEQKRLIAGFMQQFMVDHTIEIASASPAHLKAIRDQKLVFLKTLQGESVELCVQAGVSGIGPDQNPPPKVMTALTQVAVAKLNAAVANRGHGSTPLALTAEEANAWLKEMRRAGVTDQQLGLLEDPKRLTAIPPAQACSLLVTATESLTRLPPDIADRVLANVLLDEAGIQPARPSTKMEDLPPDVQRLFDQARQRPR